MSFSTSSIEGYKLFLLNNGFNNTVLPSNSDYITWTYNISIQLVNKVINTVSPLIYSLCVYNLATHNLLEVCPDQTGQTFFKDLRVKLNLDMFVTGIVQSTGDQSTNEGMLLPDFYKNFSLSELNLLTTVFGRTYMSYAQKYSYLWGMS